jgi:hypothetical protein
MGKIDANGGSETAFKAFVLSWIESLISIATLQLKAAEAQVRGSLP